MNTRWMGALLSIGAVAVMINGFRTAGVGSNSPIIDLYSSLAYVIWGIGGICGVVGLIRSNALGSNAIARAVGFLPLIGFACFVLGDGLRILGFLNTTDSLYNVFAAIAWIAMLAGMLVVGILTIAAKTWRGWRRFAPLLTIVMFPIAMGIGQATGNMVIGALLGWLPWVLLGYVILSIEIVPSGQSAAIA